MSYHLLSLLVHSTPHPPHCFSLCGCVCQVSLKPAHFDESKALIADSLVMEGTPYNIEHPDDVAVRKVT